MYVLMFDGGSRGNPGPCGCGYFIYRYDNLTSEDGSFDVIAKGSHYIPGNNTNNHAEYMALIYGLKRCISLNISSVLVKGDSMLVIKQVKKEYKVKNSKLKILYNKVQDYILQFEIIDFEHVKREKNTIADGLANRAMNNKKTIIE